MKIARNGMLIFFCFLLIGCVTSLYYYGKYPHTLYKYKKVPNEETRGKHVESIKDIFEVSEKKGMRVPPGIYCEYAYILAKEGNTDEALKFIQLEEKTYPESKVFTERLRKSILSGGTREIPPQSEDTIVKEEVKEAVKE